jgi:hypothetical protein
MDGAVTPYTRLPAAAARMLAVETLLAEPEALGDDVLETCLYLFRDRLHESAGRLVGSRRPRWDQTPAKTRRKSRAPDRSPAAAGFFADRRRHGQRQRHRTG